MQFDTTAARSYIITALSAQGSSMSVRRAAQNAFAAFQAAGYTDSSAAEVVQISRSSRAPRYVQTAYAAVAALRRSGTIVNVGSPRAGIIRLASMAPAASAPVSFNSYGAPADGAADARASLCGAGAAPAAAGSPRALFDAFMLSIRGDAGAWTQAYALADVAEQRAAIAALRDFCDSADHIIAEELGA